MWLHYPLVLITPHTTLLKSPSHSSDAKLWLPFFLPLSWVVPSCARMTHSVKGPRLLCSLHFFSTSITLMNLVPWGTTRSLSTTKWKHPALWRHPPIQFANPVTPYTHLYSSISLKSLVSSIDPCTFPLASALTQSLPSLAITENCFLPTFLNCCPHVLPKTYAWQNSIIPWIPLVCTWSRDCCWGGKKKWKKDIQFILIIHNFLFANSSTW